MKPLKMIALTSSVVLVGGYVVLRGGGGLLPGSKSARIVHTTGEDNKPRLPALAELTMAPRLMPGSKSAQALYFSTTRPDQTLSLEKKP